MLTVAVDTGPLYGSRTGVGRAVSEILTEFERRSSEIEVLRYVVSRRAELRSGTRRLPYPAFLAMEAWARSNHPRADRHLAPARIVHGMNYVVPPVRCPRIVSVYDTWALRHPDACSPVVRRAMHVLRRNIDSGATVHASSHVTAEHLREIFPHASIHVIHLGAPRRNNINHNDNDNGIDGIDKSQGAPANSRIRLDAPFILSVGTIERRKNLPRLIEAYSRSHASREGVRLVIAGGHGDDFDAVQSTIEHLDRAVGSHIVLLGRVDDRELNELYRHAAMVAYVSLDEGFGFPILEAMSHGVPLLGSTCGSIPEIAGDAAILVDSHDVEHMTTQIDRILSDNALRDSLIDKGSTRCTAFSWAATADSLIGLYRSLAEDPRRKS